MGVGITNRYVGGRARLQSLPTMGSQSRLESLGICISDMAVMSDALQMTGLHLRLSETKTMERGQRRLALPSDTIFCVSRDGRDGKESTDSVDGGSLLKDSARGKAGATIATALALRLAKGITKALSSQAGPALPSH